MQASKIVLTASATMLLASAAGALRSYLLDRGEQIDGLTIRATVPVNLRPLEHAKKLGNHFGVFGPTDRRTQSDPSAGAGRRAYA